MRVFRHGQGLPWRETLFFANLSWSSHRISELLDSAPFESSHCIHRLVISSFAMSWRHGILHRIPAL